MLWWLLGAGILAGTLHHLAEAVYIRRLAGALGRGPLPDAPLPRVTVVVAARDEARGFERAARSLLRQDHPGAEFVWVDDRSTDGTGELMDRLAAEGGARVRVVHVRTLPEGWLGKNHALYTGARAAAGEWLLFTDGDVWLAPDAVRRAVAFAVRGGFDHLALGPALTAPGYWLQGWVAFALTVILTHLSPRRMNDPRSRRAFGVGAFNLVRRHAYEATGTHRAIALRPDDDVRLGLRLRRMGFRSWAAAEPGLVRVQWYSTVGEAVRGLEKNMFAGLDYNPGVIALACAALLLVFCGPLPAAVLVRGGAAWLFRAAYLLQAATVWIHARTFVLPDRRAARRAFLVPWTYPVAALLYTYAVARSAWMALSRRGIAWRGTFYALDRLRRQSGLE